MPLGEHTYEVRKLNHVSETKTFTVTWDQRLPSAAQVDRGSYEARSFVAVVGIPQNPEVAHELSSTLRAFTIN